MRLPLLEVATARVTYKSLLALRRVTVVSNTHGDKHVLPERP